jgi:CheY-like chemotaxis protein
MLNKKMKTEPNSSPKHCDRVGIYTKSMKPDRTKTVAVLIEEDPDMRSLMRYLLENAGVEVIALQDDAFLIERVWRLNPDVVLIDLQWPPTERLALIGQLRKSGSIGALPIIALVMDMAQGEDSLRVGATAILCKPDDVQLLPDLIDRVIEQPCSREAKF